jgi:hypothetical protein
MAALAGSMALVLSAASAADAAPPRLQWGGTDCGIIEQTGIGGIGFATDFPRVYAANATYRRDLQYAYLYTQLYQWNATQSVWQYAAGSTYKALVSDNNYAIVWRDQRPGGGVLHFPYERQQFVIQTSGIWRVRQKLVWKRNGVVPGYHTNWRWLRHTGPNSQADQASSFCLIR